MMYCVGLGDPDKSPRYISTCDDNWYTTTCVKLYQYTQAQVNTVVTQLRKHFQKEIFVLDQGGNVIFNTTKPKQKQAEKVEAKGLSIKIRL